MKRKQRQQAVAENLAASLAMLENISKTLDGILAQAEALRDRTAAQ
jgi:hypothetical protein